MRIRGVCIIGLLCTIQLLGQPTPLVRAAGDADIATVRSLLAAGANPNEADNSVITGWTPLMAAAKAGSEDVAEALIDAHAEVNARNELGETALDVAIATHGRSARIASVIEAAGGRANRMENAPGGVYRIGGGVSAPVPIHRKDPDYTPEASKAGLEGTVILTIVVDEEGKPRDVRVIKPLGMGLDEKAVQSVEKWRFKPAMKDGHPVKVKAQIEVNFRLLDRHSNAAPANPSR